MLMIKSRKSFKYKGFVMLEKSRKSFKYKGFVMLEKTQLPTPILAAGAPHLQLGCQLLR